MFITVVHGSQEKRRVCHKNWWVVSLWCASSSTYSPAATAVYDVISCADTSDDENRKAKVGMRIMKT